MLNKLQKIQLIHPFGKKAVSINKRQYDVLKNAIMTYLKASGESTLSEMLQAITEDFKKNKINFEGSVAWHFEWVKLDLEARKEIKRANDKTPIKYVIA